MLSRVSVLKHSALEEKPLCWEVLLPHMWLHLERKALLSWGFFSHQPAELLPLVLCLCGCLGQGHACVPGSGGVAAGGARCSSTKHWPCSVPRGSVVHPAVMWCPPVQMWWLELHLLSCWCAGEGQPWSLVNIRLVPEVKPAALSLPITHVLSAYWWWKMGAASPVFLVLIFFPFPNHLPVGNSPSPSAAIWGFLIILYFFPLFCMFPSKGLLEIRGWKWNRCVIHPNGKKALCLCWRSSVRGGEVAKGLFLNEEDSRFKFLLWKQQIWGFLHPRRTVVSGLSLSPFLPFLL